MKYEINVLKILIAGAISLSGALLAQTTGTLRGVVKDPAGLVVAGASVQVNQHSGTLRRETLSALDGAFELVALPVGMYEVEVSADGFKTTKLSNVEISIGRV